VRLLRRMGSLALLLGAMIGLFLMTDPTNTNYGLVKYPIIKYFPYLASIIACFLFLVTNKIKFNKMSVLLFCFFFIALAGSTYALFTNGFMFEETYFGRMLGGFVFVAFYLLSLDSHEVKWFIRRFLYIFVLTTFIIGTILILWKLGLIYVGLSQMYQVKGILLVATGLLAFFIFRSELVSTFIFISTIAVYALVGKTTSLLIILTALVFFVLIRWRKIKKALLSNRKNRMFYPVLFILLFILLVFFTYMVNYSIEDRLDSRGHGVREVTFSLRLVEFIDSPVYGSLFTSSPLLDFGPLHIPSHSDILDLLSGGGMISILFFYLPLMLLIIKSFRTINRRCLNVWFSFLLLFYLVAMSVNPILFMPGQCFIIWMSLGVLCGQKELYFRTMRLHKLNVQSFNPETVKVRLH